MRYLKDKKVILYKKESGKDSAGFATTVYKPIHEGRLWAYMRQLSASQFYASAALQTKEETLFAVNWRDDLNPANCFVMYKDIFYNITRIDTYEGYKDDLKLYGAKLASQPKPGEIMEYKK